MVTVSVILRGKNEGKLGKKGRIAGNLPRQMATLGSRNVKQYLVHPHCAPPTIEISMDLTVTMMAIARVDTECQRKVDAAAEIENRTRQISSAAAALFARHLSHLSSNALLVEIIFVPPIPSRARVHCSESDGESFAI